MSDLDQETQRRMRELRAAQKHDRGLIRELQARIRKRSRRLGHLRRQVEVASLLAKYEVRRPLLVVREAERADLAIYDALALLEKETGIPQRNIFGCDYGPGRAFCHKSVTASRVDALLASGLANGVGWTQLTWTPYVEEAEKLGGAHIPRYQMRVGFKVLAGNMEQLGREGGFCAYNGSGEAATAYGRDAMTKAARWKSRGVPARL